MFKNHFITAWRNLKKGKAYAALNILGLAVGMAVFILIMLFVRTELSYDRYHAEAGNIYRVIQEQPGNTYLGSNLFAVTAGPMAPAMVRDFPEVRTAMRINRSREELIQIGGTPFIEKDIHWADPQIFDIFTLPLVRGDKATALEDPFSILFSERESRRLFGGEDPIGRTIVYRAGDQSYSFRVTGIFRDIPANSHFAMDVVAPFETMGKIQNRKTIYPAAPRLKPIRDARMMLLLLFMIFPVGPFSLSGAEIRLTKYTGYFQGCRCCR